MINFKKSVLSNFPIEEICFVVTPQGKYITRGLMRFVYLEKLYNTVNFEEQNAIENYKVDVAIYSDIDKEKEEDVIKSLTLNGDLLSALTW